VKQVDLVLECLLGGQINCNTCMGVLWCLVTRAMMGERRPFLLGIPRDA